MSTRADYRQAIDDQVSQVKFSGLAEKNKAIAKAVAVYSANRPRVRVVDQGGVGSHVAILFVLEGWDDDFSQVRAVEYPVDDSQPGHESLGPKEWQVYQGPDGKELHLLTGGTFAEGEAIRITYTAGHAVDDTASTVPTRDEVAVQSLAAACFCRLLAAAYAEASESTIHADSVDQISKRREYEAAAKSFEAEFINLSGIKLGQVKPASGVLNMDLDLANGLGDRFTHPRRWR